jgi:phenylacetate-CoA ligase
VTVIPNALQTYLTIRSALASSRWSQEKVRRRQEERLGKLLSHAYANVPLYRKLYDEAGFHPSDFRSLDDLTKIPVLQKKRLQGSRPDEVVAQDVDLSRCTTVTTSGSTGSPLKVYLGPWEQHWQRSTAWRILFEHGFRWTDRTLEIRMTFGRQFALQRLGIAPKDWVSILEPPEFWAKRFHEKQHEVVVASASTLHAMAEAVEASKLKTARPRIIISDSETLSPATRRLVKGVVGTEPVDVFGLVELSNFAWQCEERRGFHISADSHIVEVAAPTGEPGPLIATDLGMWTMPIIRYDTGDSAEAAREPCPCGRILPLLRCVYGRAVDSVLLPDGGRLFWPFFHEVLGGYGGLSRWRVVQHGQRHLEIQLVLSPDRISLLKTIELDLRRALPHEVELKVATVDDIPLKPGEKVRMVISRIDSQSEINTGGRGFRLGAC